MRHAGKLLLLAAIASPSFGGKVRRAGVRSNAGASAHDGLQDDDSTASDPVAA